MGRHKNDFQDTAVCIFLKCLFILNVNVKKKMVIEMLRGWENFHQALESDRKWFVTGDSADGCQKDASPELLAFSNRWPFKRSFHLAADLLILCQLCAVY